MNMISRRLFKRLLAITVSIASISFSTANACNGALDNKLSDQGMHNGFNYNFWKQTAESDVHINCEDDGNFSALWRGVLYWIGGKGWNTEGPQVMSYSGTFLSSEIQDQQNAYLMLYGSMATDPVTEYYVIESYGSYNPANCTFMGLNTFGSFQSDGATYDLLWCQPSRGIGVLGPKQYYSIRNPPLPWGDVSGTITIANHFNEWAKHGVNLGIRDDMTLAVHAYEGSRNSAGHVNLTITEGPFDPEKPRCGTQGGVPICCSIKADQDRDGMGEESGKMCIVTPATQGTHPGNSPDVLAAINVGGDGYAVQSGGVWYEPSTYVTGIEARTFHSNVTEYKFSPMYQSELTGDLRLSIPMSNQQVSVELSFIEFTHAEAGARVFDVTIENQRVLENLDVFAEVGYQKVWMPSRIVVDVTDGALDINLDASVGSATLSSVLVRNPALFSSSSSSSGSSGSSGSSSSSSSSGSSGSSGSSSGSAGAVDVWFLLIMAGGLLPSVRRLRRS